MSNIIPSTTACIIIIGNEILSGRTQDTNTGWLAKELNLCGVRLCEVRVVPDIEQIIMDVLNESRAKYDYVFTTGGIGPTHDDITALSVAKAFGLPLTRHPEAEAILRNYYPPEKVNDARMKMTETPEGAALIPNPISAAPGFNIGNVYVLAGVPSIMRAMFDHIRPMLKGGAPVLSREVSVLLPEGAIADGLADIQNANMDVEIGSYPQVKDGVLSTTLVLRSPDAARLNKVLALLHSFLQSLDGEII